MEFGAHLPLIDFGAGLLLRPLKEFARVASAFGYRYLWANDHLLFSRPWLDGPTALAAIIEESSDLALATTVALPVVRGPTPLAKTLTAIDVLSEGRLVVGVGPGSSARDYDAERVYADVLAPMLNRPAETLRSLSLPIGPGEVCAERPAAFAEAGAERGFLWPLRDEVAQLELFHERVAPLL